MSNNSNKFVGGKLKLKINKKKKNEKKHKSHDGKHDNYMNKNDENYEHVQIKNSIKKKKKNNNNNNNNNNNDEEENVIKGSGRVVTIKNTVQGFETKFVEEFKVGYEIILENPTSLQTERKLVTSILSNRTLLIEEEFSTDISTTCSYYIGIVKKDGEKTNNKDIVNQIELDEYVPDQHIDQVDLKYAKVFDLKPKHDIVKVREKSGLWSYKIVNKKIKGNLTNEEKLDIRVKSGRDKFCW
ncbi:hypothetical protein, conserved [Plasmodium gonderi]|uniref:Uncharacterized protein n=1 Tax=Plasmodium gonderi TaxID=77519 RepID=A0A1Y1JGX5_PLAGO|nr:hypothetical protein, conserved [Plasmodium gonderi]GAW79693.1 hypothetical protein, conserved [Plasmodium gonderi]